MNKGAWNNVLVIAGSFFLAFTLQVMPWPDFLEAFRPDWLAMVLIYWGMALPHRVNIGTACFVGVLWDLLIGSTIGVRGLALSILMYIIISNYLVIRNKSLFMQCLLIGIAITGLHLVVFILDTNLTGGEYNQAYVLSGFVNILFWPWIFSLMRKLRRQFGVK